MRSKPKLDDKSILELTARGQHQLQEPGTLLPRDQLEALIVIDGHATVAQLLDRLRMTTSTMLRPVFDALLERNFVCVVSSSTLSDFDPGSFFGDIAPKLSDADLGSPHRERVDADVGFLRRSGYCVNLARRQLKSSNRIEEKKLRVLAIDDDPDICSLLTLYMKLEGIGIQTASTRDEIITAFRETQLPDLVLLDVSLPTINGFDVLAKLRQHPILKVLPIIMLTAEANRESVIRGILAGADGYVTKPFQIQPLIRAIKAVLGQDCQSDEKAWDFAF
jgi:CheY-like chemotaxis protein